MVHCGTSPPILLHTYVCGYTCTHVHTCISDNMAITYTLYFVGVIIEVVSLYAHEHVFGCGRLTM